MRADQFNRVARRALRKKSKKVKRTLSAQEIKKLKVQTAPLWVQVLLIFAGIALIFSGLNIYTENEGIMPVLVLGIIGLGLIVIGLTGRKQTVEKCADQVLDQSVELIIDNLTDPF